MRTWNAIWIATYLPSALRRSARAWRGVGDETNRSEWTIGAPNVLSSTYYYIGGDYLPSKWSLGVLPWVVYLLFHRTFDGKRGEAGEDRECF